MTNTEILYHFINDNLMFGDLKQIAIQLNLSSEYGENTVSKTKCGLKKGLVKSRQIIAALEKLATERYNHAQQIAQYSNKKITL